MQQQQPNIILLLFVFRHLNNIDLLNVYKFRHRRVKLLVDRRHFHRNRKILLKIQFVTFKRLKDSKFNIIHLEIG